MTPAPPSCAVAMQTSRSGRVTSSGNMPPVNSKSERRRSDSATAKRLAMPGRYHTGSIAALVTRADRLLQLGHVDMRLGDGDRGADVPARRELRGEDLGDEMAPGVERDDLG